MKSRAIAARIVASKRRRPSRRVAAFAEVRKIADQQNSESIGAVEQQRIVDLEVDTQEIETNAFRVGDVVAQRLCIAGGINAVRVVGLVKRAA